MFEARKVAATIAVGLSVPVALVVWGLTDLAYRPVAAWVQRVGKALEDGYVPF